mmetsp:Transcript_28360/g.70218  ORF Transcript_28360/g.70218 Transcript_28360/m.70218 type:complete len:168 (-) Transcript_28360:623-1126(-)
MAYSSKHRTSDGDLHRHLAEPPSAHPLRGGGDRKPGSAAWPSSPAARSSARAAAPSAGASRQQTPSPDPKQSSISPAKLAAAVPLPGSLKDGCRFVSTVVFFLFCLTIYTHASASPFSLARDLSVALQSVGTEGRRHAPKVPNASLNAESLGEGRLRSDGLNETLRR